MYLAAFSRHENLQPKFGTLELKLEELEKWLVGAEVLLSSFRVTPEGVKQFEERGFYTAFNGTKIYKEDFKGVYVAGSALPMTWDFDNLVNNKPLQLKDDDKDSRKIDDPVNLVTVRQFDHIKRARCKTGRKSDPEIMQK